MTPLGHLHSFEPMFDKCSVLGYAQSMSKLAALHEGMSLLDDAWAGADDASGLSREQLIEVNDAIAALHRRLDAVHAEVAAEIAHQSRPELGRRALRSSKGSGRRRRSSPRRRAGRRVTPLVW
ncbi:hypothetical protein [Microbacterium sp. NIBRBAC000506063]|uniref:hypothetical protein n=1 Tax=Microbacterium sp. NIBRBAC000506063 TaxID=2734618 RepID=UPI001CB7550A|nr:hypothetical protein [Microbacterium sp. NIBRBAC000506063]